MSNRISKMRNFVIPIHFYVRPIIGTILIMTTSIAFYIFGIVAIQQVLVDNGSIVTDYLRSMVLQNIALTSIFIARPIPSSLIIQNVIDYRATSPVQNDLSHLTSNKTVLQGIVERSLLYYNNLANKLARDAKHSTPTGDEAIDSIDSTRVLTKKTKLSELLVLTTPCLMEDEEDCEKKDRIYGQDGEFAGLSGLIEEFIYELSITK
ncbi:MAG: hypothetical protein EZS28_016670 [Streblomastix strix]|uniref:Uncharacterized protein n=1 Tax=Streblomastix strix TaxID=222440 RepID=A0A5J4VYX7_9EUKA|nr:MAG: hypothetical protein EZS28_016670 [Streblomastix strix]